MTDWSRRDVLTAGGGVVAGVAGGVAVSPTVRRIADDVHDDWFLPDSPIEDAVMVPDGLFIELIDHPEIAGLNVIAPSGAALTTYPISLIDEREFTISRSRLEPGRYRVIAVRDREIIQDVAVDVG
jgi:hypothetical protein